MNGYFYVLTSIDIFVLGFMWVLTKLSESLNQKQKRGFLFAFGLIAFISLLEVVTLKVDGLPIKYRWLNIISNYLGFGLTPSVCICLVYVLDKKMKLKWELKIAILCEIIYLLILGFSIPFGWVFSVSQSNIYSRGPYFFIYIFAYFLSILYLSLSTIIVSKQFQNRSKALVYPLVIFLGAETIIQIIVPNLHVSWMCVTLLSVLYFIYCSEMWHQLDALTGLLNQNSFLNRSEEMHYTNGMLIVFDVDDFKHVNDVYGHVKGDLCLSVIANCIKGAYAQYGYCYRIGGDEFCVLLKNNRNEDACSLKFEHLMEVKRRKLAYLPKVSYGSALLLTGDIVSVKDLADQNMYMHKHQKKEKEQ